MIDVISINSIKNFENFNKKFYNIFIKWFEIYYIFISLKLLNINFNVFVFLNKSINTLKFIFNNFNDIDLYFAIVFKTLQLKLNYTDIKNFKSQFYSIGILLSLLKLIISKSVRRNIKGIKILMTFFLKKIIKQYRNKNCILNIKGLSKLYLKIFYFLGDLFENLNIKNLIWIPLKSWNKNNIKIVKSIKRRIKKKLIKLEYKI